MPADPRAAFYSSLIPGLGQLVQGRRQTAVLSILVTSLLITASLALGHVLGRAAEIFFFMLLTMPWWAFQTYDAYLGPDLGRTFRQTWKTAWSRGHDIRFLGLLLLISAMNDTLIILMNLDYQLPFFCTKPDGLVGFATKAVSPALHLAVGYGFLRLRRWAIPTYLTYAAYGFTNGVVNLACFGPGRIRNTVLAVIILSTIYILWRRRLLLRMGFLTG